METLIIVCLAGSALIHLPPLVGVLGRRRVEQMYDVKVEGPDLTVLLVHRAVLFGVLAAGLILAIICEDARPYAIGATLVNDVAFLAIAVACAGINSTMKRVVRADAISIALLLIAGVGHFAS